VGETAIVRERNSSPGIKASTAPYEKKRYNKRKERGQTVKE